MKTLIINGSPRKNGKIGSLMAYAGSVAGDEAEVIHLYDMDIHFCTGCMKCRKTGRCILPEDDGHRLADKIAKAERLIIGSPTHWGNMSAALKNMFDRMVPLFMDESPRGIPLPKQKGKKAIIVASCTTPYPFNILFKQSRGTVRTIREVLKTGGYRISSLEIPGTKTMEALPEKYRARIRKQITK